MIKATELDRIATIEGELTSQDEYGTPTTTWAPIATVRAQRLDNSANDFLRADGEGTENLAVFKVRYRSDVSTKDRLTVNGIVYDITAVVEMGRKRGLELRCRERT